MAHSFKAEVIADSSGTWCSNGLRFATSDEAHRYGNDLSHRWTLVQRVQVTESDDPVNARWDYTSGRTIHVQEGE